MGKLIDDIQDGLEHLPPPERDRLERQISNLVNQAVREHGRTDRNGGDAEDHTLAALYGALHSGTPRASDDEVSASIAKHVGRENPRPAG